MRHDLLDSDAPASSPKPPPPELSLTDRIGRVPLIGREPIIERVLAAIERSIAGRPSLTLVTGDSGLGKTRVLNAVVDRARTCSLAVAWGRCVDEQGLPPFLPWLDLLGQIEPATAEMTLARDGLLGSGDRGGTPEERRLAAYERVLRALIEGVLRRPLLIVIDDLQWSDPSTNQLLRYVIQHARAAPIALLGALRDDELAPNHELRRTLTDLDRDRRLVRIAIDPLSAPETSALLAHLHASAAKPGWRPIAPADDDGAVHRMIAESSGGNPFLVEEIARAISELPADAPVDSAEVKRIAGRELADLIAPRLARLEQNDREIVHAAALCGREVAVDVLATALDLPWDRVVDALDRAIDHAIVVVAPDRATAYGGLRCDYLFRHDQMREAVASGISPGQRRRLHARLARAFETLTPSDVAALGRARLSALVVHAERGRMIDLASRSAARLAEASWQGHAFAEAIDAAETAIRLAPPGDSSILLLLGDARLAAGESTALDAYRAVESMAKVQGDLHLQATALHRQGIVMIRREAIDRARPLLDAAAAIWDRSDDDDQTAMRASAQLHIDLCQSLGLSAGRYGDAIRAGQRALALVARLPSDPSLASGARQALGATVIRAGRLDEGRAMLESALPLALTAGRDDLAAQAAGMLANHAYWIADLDTSERYAHQRRDLAQRAGDPFAGRHALPWLANIALARGAWESARSLIAAARGELDGVDSPEPHAFLDQLDGMVAISQGDVQHGLAALERAVGGFRRSASATLPWYIGVWAWALVATGEHRLGAMASAETEAAIERLPRGALPRAPAIAHLGLIARETGDTLAQRRWLAELEPYAGQHHWVLIDRVRAALLAADGHAGAAALMWDRARLAAERGGMLPERLLIDADRILWMHAERPRSETVRHDADRARAALIAAGMPAAAERLQAGLDARIVSSLPAGLTEREGAVLALVADGLTNRQIAERLGITEKTATNHLTHIFTKIGVENRAAATAFAHRHGLAT